MDVKEFEKGKCGDEEEEMKTLKKRISGHALFTLLINTHLDCLKVSIGEKEDEDGTCEAAGGDTQQCNEDAHLSPAALDRLMEVHCVALKKLKEELKIQVQETLAFIDDMYSQLH